MPHLEAQRDPRSSATRTLGRSVEVMDQVDVSVVIPCFNERDGIADLHQRLLQMIEESSELRRWEFLLVDDGSTDGTAQVIESTFGHLPWVRVVSHAENRGLIAALQTGFEAAHGRWVACLDADCTYSPSLVNQLLDRALDGYDVVSVSPYHPQGRVENVTAWRIALSRIASRM